MASVESLVVHYDAVIFDNDGVLTEPTPISVLHEATIEAFAAVGVNNPDPEFVDGITLNATEDALNEACEAYDLDADDLWYERDLAASRAQVADMEDGRKPLYDDYNIVHELDVPRGIVSTNQNRTIEHILDYYEIRDDFDTYYGREMERASIAKKKPDPHYLDLALADLGVEPEQTLFIGDSETDVEAANNAGTDSAFLWRTHNGTNNLAVTPDYELDGLTELNAIV